MNEDKGPQSRAKTDGSIVLEDVTYSYGTHRVLNGITTSISRGEFMLLVGSNGAGKSTLMQIIAGEVAPDSGRAIMRLPGGCVQSPRYTRNVAFLPQDLQDPPFMTVREIVSLARFLPGRSLGWRLTDDDKALVEECLSHCAVDRLADRTFAQLSGGEKQRAWLAFTLAQQRDFILLDESFRSLDTESRSAMFNALCNLADQGKGIVLVTHDLDLTQRQVPRVLLLRDGRLCHDGPPSPVWSSADTVADSAAQPAALPEHQTGPDDRGPIATL